MNLQDYFKNDEIDLIDLLKILIKRKFTILTVVCVATLFAVVITVPRGRVYEATAFVRMGSIAKPILTKLEASGIIQSSETLNSVIKTLKLNVDTEALKNTITVEELADRNLITITVKYADRKLAIKICDALSETFVYQGNQIYAEKIKLANENIKQIKKNRHLRDRQNKISVLEDELSLAKGFEIFSLPIVSMDLLYFTDNRYEIIITTAYLSLLLIILIIFIQKDWKKVPK